MPVGTLEEIIDDNHAIVSSSMGSEYYVSILSFVDKDQLEPGCTILMNHKVRFGVCVCVCVCVFTVYRVILVTNNFSAFQISADCDVLF